MSATSCSIGARSSDSSIVSASLSRVIGVRRSWLTPDSMSVRCSIWRSIRARMSRKAAPAARTWLEGLSPGTKAGRAAREAELTGPREGEAEADESPAHRLLRQVRERLGDDLDAPGALRAVDAWADQALRGEGSGQAGLVRDLIAARLGVAL